MNKKTKTTKKYDSIEDKLARLEKRDGSGSLGDVDVLCRSYRLLYNALEKSIELQSHYAKLLNIHDGGKRIPFKNAKEWIIRLIEIGG